MRAERRRLAPGERVLVFDVGGGTTDFTLIDGRSRRRRLHAHRGRRSPAARRRQPRSDAREDRRAARRRAHRQEARRAAVARPRPRVPAREGDAARRRRRRRRAPIVVQSRGAKLIGGTLRDEVTRAELDKVLFDGFFPLVAARRAARARPRRPAGVRPALRRRSGGDAPPRGVPRAPRRGARRRGAVQRRRDDAGVAARARARSDRRSGRARAPRELPAHDARDGGRAGRRVLRPGPPRPRDAHQGRHAARVLHRRRCERSRRASRRPRSAASSPRVAVCLAPPGLDDGARVQLERDFQLVTNRPVSFRLYSSSTRDDHARRAGPDRRRQGRDASTTAAICSSCRRSSPCCARAAAARSRCASRSTSPSSARSRSTASTPSRRHETWKLAFDMRSGGAAQPEANRTPTRRPPATDEAKALIQGVRDGRGPRRR